MNPPPRPRRPARPTTALFVRIPAEQAVRLDRAAFALGRPKQDLVASLLEHYVDPDSPAGLSALREAPDRSRRPLSVAPGQSELPVGHYSFRSHPAETAEVLSLEQAAVLLQVEVDVLEAMAQQGELPARRLGNHWRLSRRALIEWLAASDCARATPDAPAKVGPRSSGSGPGADAR